MFFDNRNKDVNAHGKYPFTDFLEKVEKVWRDCVWYSTQWHMQDIYGREMYETWYKMIMMIQCGLNISPIMTHQLHYTEFEKAFEVMRSGQSGKVVLDWQKK